MLVAGNACHHFQLLEGILLIIDGTEPDMDGQGQALQFLAKPVVAPLPAFIQLVVQVAEAGPVIGQDQLRFRLLQSCRRVT